MKLPFTHGIEIENHLVDIRTGKLVVGDTLLASWERMFSYASDFLKALLTDPNVPAYIRKKIRRIETTEEMKRERKLKFISVSYQLGKGEFRTNVFGPDPNISSIT